MTEKDLIQKTKAALDHKRLEPENLFLFHLLDFNFIYGENEQTCTVECPVTEPMLNPIGTVHGGIYTYIADTAMGHLNFKFKDAPYVALELKTSYFKTVSDGKIFATARYSKNGYKVAFLECVITNEQNETLCVTSGTFYRYEKK
ncbi:PaaI family thioesterase [Desertibacillus haloalkaliphilus]|uniref:PaaI family thioesterase n=1 Tax=Desertibacillus haloalkaliphilus TaxID=1328930 RepID=UPI001C279CD7|nr:PaaI family thioesterase [Desertibacillus haloalkaliphilus]MBU8906104.1 PaaI family thioesterase [Desertibacillus haloalkaliphilus]